jgi:hypothetical protein
MIVILLIVHGLLAVALLGAITHQAFAVRWRRPAQGARSFIDQFSGVDPKAYVSAIVLLFVTTSIGGAFLYPQYRLDVRPTLEDLQYRAANGVFEIKEHLAAIGLGMLPAYVVLWTRTPTNTHCTTRRYVTWILAIVVWWSFLIGHVLNNIKGLVP